MGLIKTQVKRTLASLGVYHLGNTIVPKVVMPMGGRDVIFIHIPKTGGTSITSALGYDTLPHDSGKFSYTQTGQEIPIAKPQGLYPVHNTLKESYDYVFPKTFNNAFKFAIVRNPWDHAISFYKYFVKINKCRMADLPIDFNTWVEWVYGPQKHPYYYYLPKFFEDYFHWLSLDGKTISVDFVGRLEHMQEDWQTICKHIGTDIDLPVLNQTAGDKKAQRHAMFNARSRQLIAEKHARDIEQWGYAFDD